jgi:hypothetical protein
MVRRSFKLEGIPNSPRKALALPKGIHSRIRWISTSTTRKEGRKEAKGSGSKAIKKTSPKEIITKEEGTTKEIRKGRSC